MTAQATAVPVTATATLRNGAGTYRGLALFSTTGSTVVVYDGVSAAGTILAKFTLAAGGDKQIDVADGVRVTTGVHITCTAAVEGHVRIG